MDSTSDPLLALRHAVKSKSPITYLAHGKHAQTLLTATHLALGAAVTLPKSSPTRYTKPGVSSPSSTADVYTLEAVYLAWLLRDAPGAEYMRQARESGLTVGFVSVTERKSVVEWLEGKVADLERIRPLASGTWCFSPSIRRACVGLLVHGFGLCCCRVDDAAWYAAASGRSDERSTLYDAQTCFLFTCYGRHVAWKTTLCCRRTRHGGRQADKTKRGRAPRQKHCLEGH